MRESSVISRGSIPRAFVKPGEKTFTALRNVPLGRRFIVATWKETDEYRMIENSINAMENTNGIILRDKTGNDFSLRWEDLVELLPEELQDKYYALFWPG
jgi:hypothetical protein